MGSYVKFLGSSERIIIGYFLAYVIGSSLVAKTIDNRLPYVDSRGARTPYI